MAKQENLTRYLAHLEKIGRANLVPMKDAPSNTGLLAMKLAAEGLAMLEAEEKAKKPEVVPPVDDTQKLNTTLAATSPNPYVRARIKVLEDLPPAHRKLIESLERTKDTDNRTYERFAAKVTELAINFPLDIFSIAVKIDSIISTIKQH